MAGDLPLALRRTQRRRRQHDLDDKMPKKTPAQASQRKSSRATAAAQKKSATTTRTAGKAVRLTKKSKAGDSESVSAADDATDDSVTLVDDADDSITALDFDIPISSSSNKNNKRKRPSQNGEGNQQAIKKVRRQTKNNDDDNNSSVVHILPLRRQILDDHIIRRIRRNGLSSEMNEAYAEKRARRQKTLQELRRAREELRDRDAEIERLRELTALFGDGPSQHQHDHTELELELSRLREQVLGRRRRDNDDDVELTSSPPVARGDDHDDGWGGIDGMSDAGDSDAGGDFGAHEIDDDEEFGEASLAELESGGTPGQHRQQQKSTAKRPTALRLHGPTLTPPSTSPTKLASSPVRQTHPSKRSSDAGVQVAVVADMSNATDAASQVCIPDPAVDALHEELSTLRAEVSSLNETLQERDAVKTRVGEKLARHQLSAAAGSSSSPSSAQDFELQLDIVLQDLAEKTDRLGELSALLTLPPTTSSSSGDLTTDNSHKEATAQLSSALQSVRETLSDLDPSITLPQSAAPTLVLAATRLRELDTALAQRTAAHEALTTDLAASKAAEASNQTQIKNLSADIAHLSETIDGLHEEIDVLQSTSTTQRTDLDSARDAALQQKTAAAEAEARLAEAVGRVASLSQQLAERESALKGRDGEVERLKGGLVAAGATISKLKGDAARERARSGDAVRAMRAQMLVALRVGEGFLGDEGVAKTEEVDVVGGGGVSEAAARDRSDDSGLGLGEEVQLV